MNMKHRFTEEVRLMSPVTKEDERRVREKYGDLLDKIEEEREPLNKEQCLALLPPEAPRSGSIFTSGFYYSGRGIKYRTALGEALVPYSNHSGIIIVHLLVKLLLGAMAIGMFKQGKILISLFIFVFGYIDIIAAIISLTLCPYAEIDLNKKVVKIGRLFISKIPFSKIDFIEVTQMQTRRIYMAGTYVFLCYSNNYIEFASLHTWEEDDSKEMIKKSLLCLLGELQVRYIS
jgi:hypothetical protein